ncbi:MAG TPA: sigma factor, partial [Candidatus Deferrimicrobium sp.]|nr:sigma factor [Candidatus Deferrimicrobium sp.]
MQPAEQPTDDALVAAAGAGDETAFETLFNRHRRQVARIGGRFFAQREQIEDIIQDTFTKLYFALHNYHGTHEASFKAWLAQITVNA